MIFRRLMTPLCMRRGTDMISCSTPSMRKRMAQLLGLRLEVDVAGRRRPRTARSRELTSLTIGRLFGGVADVGDRLFLDGGVRQVVQVLAHVGALR